MILTLILYTLGAGLPIFIGGILAWIISLQKIKYQFEFYNSMISLGGGILLASVGFVLIPHSINEIHIIFSAFFLLLGCVCFASLNEIIKKYGQSYSQVAAMLLDYIPEIIALGALYATQSKYTSLLLVFIALQNLPEGFNAYKDFIKNGYSVKKTLLYLFLISVLGIFPALFGYELLVFFPSIVAIIMLFAAGGILYFVFQDIIPNSVVKSSQAPSFSGVLGFLLGMIGYFYLG